MIWIGISLRVHNPKVEGISLRLNIQKEYGRYLSGSTK